MTTGTSIQRTELHTKRRMAVLVSLALGAALAGVVALAGTAQQADAALAEKIVFESNRTTGKNVNNPTGDYEIFSMNPDGTGVRQLTANKGNEYNPILSPGRTKIAYTSSGNQISNPEGDRDVYVMNALDGSSKKNLSNNGSGTKVVYMSYGIQTSNPEGDHEIYSMNTLDGKSKKPLTDNDAYDTLQ